jgi:hypothetical protein
MVYKVKKKKERMKKLGKIYIKMERKRKEKGKKNDWSQTGLPAFF